MEHHLKRCGKEGRWTALAVQIRSLLMQGDSSASAREARVHNLDVRPRGASCVQRKGGRAGGAYQPNACAHPGTVVVEFLDTVVADSAVGAAGRPPMVACRAPLGLHHEAIDLMFLEARPSPAPITVCLTAFASAMTCCVVADASDLLQTCECGALASQNTEGVSWASWLGKVCMRSVSSSPESSNADQP